MADRRLRVLRRGVDGELDDDEVLAHLDATTIEIRLGGEQPAWNSQLLGEALVDLLSRVFPRIQVTCAAGASSDPRLPPGPELLAERLELIRAHGMPPLDPGEPSVAVHVGPGGEPADLYADGVGWQGYIGTQPSRLPPEEVRAATIGPLSAAARAAAHAYLLAMKPVVDGGEPPSSVYWSGLDYTVASDPLTITAPLWEPRLDAVLAGAGSIGGAGVYAFARTPGLAGAIDVVDPQQLTEDNPDRALLATAELSAAEEVKADAAAAALAHVPDLAARPHETDLAGFVASRPREQMLPLTLCAVDSVEARRSIQDCLPLELVNAACDPTDSVVSGHRTGSGPCVMCLFMQRILDREQALFRLIARGTSFNERMVAGMMATRSPLNRQHLRGIEEHRGLPRGSLKDYEGRTLRELWHGQLVYGGHRIQTDRGAIVVVAAPWVTALAGFLLASEALKAGDVALGPYRLGPTRSEPGARYAESVYASPEYAYVRQPERWQGEQCLCNSPRRRAIIIERYGLEPDEYSI